MICREMNNTNFVLFSVMYPPNIEIELSRTLEISCLIKINMDNTMPIPNTGTNFYLISVGYHLELRINVTSYEEYQIYSNNIKHRFH